MIKDVVGYEGMYAVTDDGRVYSYITNKFLKPVFTRDGYLRVCLCKDGTHKTKSIHRIVATAYIPNKNGLPSINHKDENKENNSVSNLEWCDFAYNANYGSRNLKLSITRRNDPHIHRDPVLCVETGIVYPSKREAERQTGTNHANIGRAITKNQRAGEYHWANATN